MYSGRVIGRSICRGLPWGSTATRQGVSRFLDPVVQESVELLRAKNESRSNRFPKLALHFLVRLLGRYLEQVQLSGRYALQAAPIREMSMFHGFGPEGAFDFEDEVTYFSAISTRSAAPPTAT
jgi:2,3-bisphosphoglycerate-independent phosphoglycerate mutase